MTNTTTTTGTINRSVVQRNDVPIHRDSAGLVKPRRGHPRTGPGRIANPRRSLPFAAQPGWRTAP
jgi:hypothetical protein